jgi:hypothetical protein
MKKTILFLSLATILSASTAFAATTPVACGDMAKQVETAMKGAKLSPADLTAATKHNKAGNDLCKAKKDAAANVEFEAVMKMLKK